MNKKEGRESEEGELEKEEGREGEGGTKGGRKQYMALGVKYKIC